MAKGGAKTVVGSLPQSIQAFQVTKVGAADSKTNQRQIQLSNGAQAVLTGQQHISFLPAIGDYYVIPSEGDPYCISQTTFRKDYIVGDNG